MKPAALLLLVLIHVAWPAASHRLHFAWTSVTFDARDSMLRLEHRFHEHDAAEWLRMQTARRVDITALESQARFALHVSDAFNVHLEGRPLALETIGAELEGPWLFVYQQAPTDADPMTLRNGLAFSSRVLMALHPDQRHHVDARLGNHHASAVLTLEEPRAGLSSAP